MDTGLLDRVAVVSMCRKNGYDIFNPFTVIGMCQPVNMGEDVRIMPMGFLMTWSVGMIDLVVLRFKRVRQVSDLLLPYRFKDLVMGPEFIEPDNPAPHLTGGVVVDYHAVAEKFLADGGAGWVNCTQETRPIGVPERKYAPFLRSVLTVVLHVFKSIGKLIRKFRQHMHLEEFVGYTIPAKIIMLGNLSLNFYELSKARAASPTAVALKFHHSNIHFMLNWII
jgi:hypothetical protein